jgi:hypothetical protein
MRRAILALHDFFLPVSYPTQLRTYMVFDLHQFFAFIYSPTYIRILFPICLVIFCFYLFSNVRTYVHVDFVIVPLARINTFGYFFSCETGKVSRKQWENCWYATVCFHAPPRFQSPQIWRRWRICARAPLARVCTIFLLFGGPCHSDELHLSPSQI